MARKRKGDGQTALVTGASAGIGVDLAECFAADGYNLILAARSEGALKEVATRLSDKHKVEAAAIAVDLGTPGGGAKLADEIKKRGLKVDVLVNNAGYGIAGGFSGSKRDDQLGMIDLNDRVLNVASTAAFQPGPLMAVYYASKAFVLSFSEALWEEARDTGVKVSCLCPGPTKSKFRERAGTGKTRLSNRAVMTSAAVAQQGYRAFQANQRVKINGFSNAMTARLIPFLPRATVLRIVRGVQSPA